MKVCEQPELVRELRLPTAYELRFPSAVTSQQPVADNPPSTQNGDLGDSKAAQVEPPLRGRDAILKALEIAEKNRTHVIHCALFIEEAVSAIVARHFFPEKGTLRDEFSNVVLNSDWCSYSAKRKLLSHVIESNKMVEGKDKQRIQENLRKVGAWRNAFAHGKMYEQDGFI